jgi:hypothetical protein
MKLAFLAHPLGAPTRAGIHANLERAIRWYKWACDAFWPSHVFEATWMLNCQVFDDADDEQRLRGIERNFAALMRCDSLWLVGGRVSSGMRDEAVFMAGIGKPIFDFTHLGDEPPAPDSPYLSDITEVDPARFSTVV